MRGESASQYLNRFVSDLKARGLLQSEWLEKALLRVPRHLFIDQYYDGGAEEAFVLPDPDHLTEDQLRLIYSDRGLMIRLPPDHSAATQPGLVLEMLEDLGVEPGQRVLEIGTGSGWNAALLACGTGDDRLVFSIDIQPDLIEAARAHLSSVGFPRVNLLAADGGHGWGAEASFDRIIVTVGCPDIPPAWCAQLADGGALLVPFKTGGVGDPVLRLRRDGSRVAGEFTGESWFRTLQGDFWSSSEDELWQPPGPEWDELLAQQPTRTALPCILSAGCLFFMHLLGHRFQTVRDPKREGEERPAFLDHGSGTVWAASRQEPVVDVYGDPSAGERLVLEQREWMALGQPGLRDYRIEVIDADATADAPAGWVVRRPHATLRFSLKGE